jgi:nucleotidyltransferase/DNA polymerase involved in DNA repair
MRLRLIGHVDADCFYVSAERVRFPFLCGKPVGVLGNQGACVIAKSYEMKAHGIQTGEPIWDARKKCPNGVYLKRDFRWYEVLSRKMLAEVRLLSPAVEYYSIDEFFFDATLPPGQSPQELAEALRDRFKAVVGVPATVGIARSKSLAKLVSDNAKPFGALALTDPDAERALLDRLPVTAITGIAARRAARLESLGVRSCLDFALADRRRIRRLLTVVGEVLWWELNGTPVQPLYTERPPHKVLSRGGSLGGPTADPDRLHAWLARNTERLVEELEYHAVAAGRLQVIIMHWNGGTGAHEIDLAQPTDRFDRLLDAGKQCFVRSWVPGVAASRMHLIATRLRRPGFVQQGLFEPPERQARAIAKLKREVNAKVGRFALRSGATLPLYDVYRDREQGYDVCDIRGKMCF